MLVDGRIKWVIDAYTSSEWFPYSEGIPGAPQTKYLRNSVKVTVDAFDGTHHLLRVRSRRTRCSRRGARSSRRSSVDGAKIPPAIREHFRYPQGLFMAQAEVYRTYHMTDPRVFYNKEDQWEIPGERQGKTDGAVLRAHEAAGRDAGALLHHVALHAAQPRQHDRLGGRQLRSREVRRAHGLPVPQGARRLGPEQVSAQINQDALISPQLSLWNQRGSSGDLRQHARHPDQGLDRLRPAALPPGRADRDSRAHAGDRRVRRQGRDGEHAGGGAAQGVRPAGTGRHDRVGGVSSETTGGALGAGERARDRSRTSPRHRSSTSMRSQRSARATGRPTAARSRSSARY